MEQAIGIFLYDVWRAGDILELNKLKENLLQ